MRKGELEKVSAEEASRFRHGALNSQRLSTAPPSPNVGDVTVVGEAAETGIGGTGTSGALFGEGRGLRTPRGVNASRGGIGIAVLPAANGAEG
ncbi:hypothetical protein HK101_009811 [Irineochytrium annulatum]|nr:hypothetical protein HK101_009811 [Irineochytrium annulatum]